MEKHLHNTKELIYGAFCLGKLELAIKAQDLQEVVNYPSDLVEVPMTPDYFMGVFSLRNSIVPVVNMRALLQQNDVSSVSQEWGLQDCVAIIMVDGNRLGLLFDQTSEVLRITQNQIGHFSYAEGAAHASDTIQGIISLEEGQRLVQVLNSKVLLSLPDIPLSTEETVDGVREEVSQTWRRCINFMSNNNRYGFRIDAVSEIIPMMELLANGMGSKMCLGQITLRGTELPVLDFSRLLGADVIPSKAALNRIVIAIVNGQPVGFKVDSVEGITQYAESEIQKLPDFGDNSNVVLSGCIVNKDANDIGIVDHDKLFSMPQVTAPAEVVKNSNAYINKDELNTRVNGSSTTYLVVNLGFDFVLPVSEISEIIDAPEAVSQIPGAPEYINGLFNLREKVITVVSMRRIYEITAARSDLIPKLLIIDHAGQLIGLRVDGVKDIVKMRADSERSTPTPILRNWTKACRQDIQKTLVDDDRALPLLPISSILDRISPSPDNREILKSA